MELICEGGMLARHARMVSPAGGGRGVDFHVFHSNFGEKLLFLFILKIELGMLAEVTQLR